MTAGGISEPNGTLLSNEPSASETATTGCRFRAPRASGRRLGIQSKGRTMRKQPVPEGAEERRYPSV